VLQLKNLTPFEGTLLVMPDADGIDTVFTVIKATFALADGLPLASAQLPVTLAAQYHGDPGTSSVRVPSDVCLAKPGTDVLLLGSAWAPAQRPVRWMDVSLTVGAVSRTVRVFGDRHWEDGPAGAAASAPEPFVRMPLVWERAFGGADETPKGPVADARNPVGTGFRAPDGSKLVDGLPLPNLEDPVAPISSWKERPQPACFAPLAAHWQPRVSYAGTYDAAWQKTRAPYLPADFDARFFQLAPPSLVSAPHLTGGELVDVRGTTPHGWLQFNLPFVNLGVSYRLDSGVRERPALLDTVIVDSDVARLIMVWRAALPCDKKVLAVREVQAAVLPGSHPFTQATNAS
jgi:hypothetical protein